VIIASTSERANECDYLLALRDQGFQNSPVELLSVDSLADSYSPRVAGENTEHVRLLAELIEDLPPIVVHRQTMKVIDGMHRLHAARLAGLDHIAASYFDGKEGDAFLLAVAINVSHGLPLSVADRAAAAERILAANPRWSDRAVAAVAGLSASKVSKIRAGLSNRSALHDSRVGRDGKVRPLSAARGRELAYRLLKENPCLSLRQVAQQAGISPATVADVRDRMRRGVGPVPAARRDCAARSVLPRQGNGRSASPRALSELIVISSRLSQDPSLRYNDLGRLMLRLFEVSAVVGRDWQRIASWVPPHNRRPMSDLMHGYANLWRQMAEELKEGSLPAGKAR
jgi:ParB-like chromosome segregation protein Spo0J